MDSHKWGWISHMLKTDISVLNTQFSSQNHLFFNDTVSTNFLPACLKHRCVKFRRNIKKCKITSLYLASVLFCHCVARCDVVPVDALHTLNLRGARRRRLAKQNWRKLRLLRKTNRQKRSWFKKKFQSASKMVGRTYRNRREDTTKICGPRQVRIQLRESGFCYF